MSGIVRSVKGATVHNVVTGVLPSSDTTRPDDSRQLIELAPPVFWQFHMRDFEGNPVSPTLFARSCVRVSLDEILHLDKVD